MNRPVTYLFIDAGHLKQNFASVMAAWVGRNIDFYVPSISQFFAANKTFFYDSIDDQQGKDETSEQFERRVKEQEAALRAINAFANTHVRFGSITGGGKRKRQKEVDILIAVDMMSHAVRQNMERAALLTGDRDFTPLVETLVQLGLTVEVAGDRRFTSDVLQAAADAYRPLALTSFLQFVHPNERQTLPALPSFNGGHSPEHTTPAFAVGRVGDYDGKLLTRRGVGFSLEMTNRYDSRYTTVDGLPDLSRLAKYLELEYGDVPWLREAERRLTP